MHCMDEQLTFRIPRALARALARRAREWSVPRAQLVREAVAAYLAGSLTPPASGATPGEAWARVRDMVGSVPLDRSAIEADALARRIHDHNWRDPS